MLVLHRKHKYRNSIGLKVLIVYRQIRLQEKKKEIHKSQRKHSNSRQKSKLPNQDSNKTKDSVMKKFIILRAKFVS